jgi:hypothetical protein
MSQSRRRFLAPFMPAEATMADKPDIRQFPSQLTTDRPAPRRIVRPCEHGLALAIDQMEVEMGSVQAYNQLCDIAGRLKRKIDAGDGIAQHAMWATDPKMIYPAGRAPLVKKKPSAQQPSSPK